MKSFTTQDKKQLIIYGIVAFALPYVLGLLMWYGSTKGCDLSVFASAQMFYPAAGVMLAVLLTRRGDALVPKRFMITYLVSAALALACTVLAVTVPGSVAMILINYVMIGTSILLWVMLLTEKKKKRSAYGLTAHAWKMSAVCVVAFLVLYLLRMLVSFALSGAVGDFFAIFQSSGTWMYLAFMPVNFLLAFIAFFGEEYGWRYFLQPLLQKRFGAKAGALLLGGLWGIWHLPLNLFYYSASGYALQSIVAQLITCVSLGIFMGYAYMKTKNIWVPVIIHFINNNIVPIFASSASGDVLSGQVIGWGDLALLLVLNGVAFCLFLLAKPFRKDAERLPTLEERADSAAAEQAEVACVPTGAEQ